MLHTPRHRRRRAIAVAAVSGDTKASPTLTLTIPELELQAADASVLRLRRHDADLIITQLMYASFPLRSPPTLPPTSGLGIASGSANAGVDGT